MVGCTESLCCRWAYRWIILREIIIGGRVSVEEYFFKSMSVDVKVLEGSPIKALEDLVDC